MRRTGQINPPQPALQRHSESGRIMHQTGSLDQIATLVTADRTLGEDQDVADMCCELRVLE